VFEPILTPPADEKHRKMLQWICSIDPSVNHAAARKKHEATTGDWFVNGKEFDKWKTSGNSLL